MIRSIDLLTILLRLVILGTLIGNASFAAEPVRSFASRKEVKHFIHEMHQKHGLDKSRLTSLFAQYGTEHKILQLMSKQYEALPWYQYKKGVVTETRAKEGALFWKKHAVHLKKAERHFGVPAEIIVAIIGIETSYGQKKGNYPVIQSLATLAFDYPRRAPFFREELEHFLLLSEEGAIDPKLAKGSFAGAIGIPQFMPSSYRRYAVSFSETGKRDLIDNPIDAIGSVANYLKKNGWHSDEKIAYPAVAIGKNYQNISTSKTSKPTLFLSDLAKYQVKPKSAKFFKNTNPKVKHMVLDHSNEAKEHWLGLHNFSVIMRYNHSIHYAMAVYQLSQQIRSLHQK